MLSGGAGRAYGFDIENIMTCPPPTTSSSTTSHSSSLSSTLSESINSHLAISNQKPRTPRKRPNQTYNEAAVLLSIACPKVFSIKNVTNKYKNKNLSSKIPLILGSRQNDNSFYDPPEMFLPENSGFLIHRPITEKPGSGFGSYPVRSPLEFDYRNCDSRSNSMEFDTESMLDEEIGEGIDSIMGISHSTPEKYDKNYNSCPNSNSKTCYGYPMGLGFGGNLEFNFGMGMRNGIRALKNDDGVNWWSFPTVNVVNILPPVTAKKIPLEKKKKKKKKTPELELERNSGEGSKLLLKLNYDDVLNAWSDKGSPLPGSESPGGDIHSKLAQIDLFSENDGLRKAGVVCYREKKCTRLFSKKIRYQVRKINDDRRPRSKGRFIRSPDSPTSDDT